MRIEFDDLIPRDAVAPRRGDVSFDDLIPQQTRPGVVDRIASGVRRLLGGTATPLSAVSALSPIAQAVANAVSGPPQVSALERMPDVAPPLDFIRDSARAAAAQRVIDESRARHLLHGTIGPIVGPDATAASIARGIGAELAAAPLAVRGGLRQGWGDLTGDSEALAGARRDIGRADIMRAAATPEFETATGQGLYSGLVSTARQLPLIAAGIALRSPQLALAGLVGPMVPEEYGRFRQRGAEPGVALPAALGTAATEYLTERMPMGFLVERFGRAGAGQFLTGLLAREVPGEQVATLVQDAIDTAVANPDKTWGDYLAERPGAAYQTLLATITQAGIMGGGHAAARRLLHPQPTQDQLAPVAPAAPATPAAPPDAAAVNRIVQAIEQTAAVAAAGRERQAQAARAAPPATVPAPAPVPVPPAPAPAPAPPVAAVSFDDLMPQADAAVAGRQAPAAPPADLAGAVDAIPLAAFPGLQNRNRATSASIAQMQSIAARPDYARLGFSRDFASGAPVVAGGQIAPEQLGRVDVAVASDGRRVPVQYALVEAADVLTSHNADGTPNRDYGDPAVQRTRAIAGNGRIAGLRQAFDTGRAGDYVRELLDDSTMHGIAPEAIRSAQQPVLVRVMPADQVSTDIGDVSNIAGALSLSAVEQAKNDARRVELDALEFAEDGSITPQAVRQFVRAMPAPEQGELIDTDGQPTRQAVDRLNAAVFARAYGRDALVRLYAQAQDPEARNIMSALAQVAPKMARLEGAGDLDIRDLVTQAAEIAVNARREGRPLAQAARQLDLTADPAVGAVLDLFAANARSVRPVVEALGRAADFAHAQSARPAEDMFGPVARATRADVVDQLRTQDDTRRTENLEQPAGRELAARDVDRASPRPAAAAGPAGAQADRPAEDRADRVAEPEPAPGALTVAPGAQEDGHVQAPRRPYTDDRQLQLFIDNGPVESQAGPAAEAAQRAAVAAVDDIHATRTLLGLALSRDYAARQRASLVGQQLSSAEDLAVLAQVYRDPRFETFRVVFVGDGGRVVSQVGLTSRLPASAEAVIGADVDAYLRDMASVARSRGATGFYMLHNHPSGNARPSDADRALTSTFAWRMPLIGFKSHVVIDTNEYSTIDGDGRVQTFRRDFGQPAPYLAQEWADVHITGPGDVMRMAQRLQVDDGAVTLIHTDRQYRVKAISTLPSAVATLPKQALQKQVARASLRAHGSQVFAVGRDRAALLAMAGMVRDGIEVRPDGSVRALSAEGVAGGQPLPQGRRARLSPDTSPEFAYLRQTPAQRPAALGVAEPDGQGVAREGPAPQAPQAPEAGQPTPLGRPPSPHRDALGRFKFRQGEVGFDTLSASSGPILERFHMRGASRELRMQLRAMKATIEDAREQAKQVAQTGAALTPAEWEMVSDIVEKMLAPGVVPPEHVVRVADAITRAMGLQTDELVDLDMLDSESAERLRGRYLPRFYDRSTELADDPLVMRMFKTGRPTAAGIGGGSLKGRGLFETVSIDAVDQWTALGWEVRDPHWKMVQGKLEMHDPNPPRAARDVVTVWRDYSPSERLQMGEIRNALYRFIMGYTAMQRDIAVGRLFKNIASNPEWVRQSAAEGWVQVPATKIADTGGLGRYGHLAGLYVRQDVMDHLTQHGAAAGDALALYREAMGLWKQGKVALNPVSHFNNIVGNVMLLHFAGVSIWDVHKYALSAYDLITGAPMVAEGRKAGLFTGSFTTEEIVEFLPPELQQLSRQQEGVARKVGGTILDMLTFWLRKPLSKLYELEDMFFRYTLYRDSRKHGLGPEDAVDHTLRYIFSYDDLPKGARAVRDTAIPFFSFTYKVTPALIHTAMVYPWRFLTPAAILGGINAVAYTLAAGDEDDDWVTAIGKGQELEDAERSVLPRHMQGHSVLLNPKSIRLGHDPRTGLPIFLDVSRVVPGGDMFDMINQAGGVNLPAPLMPNNPIISATIAMLANKEMFLGREIVLPGDTPQEAFEKRARWMATLLLPAISPGGLHSQRILNATAHAMDTVLEVPVLGEFTGIDRTGRPVTAGYAAMHTFGIRARPMDLDLEEQRRNTQEAATARAIAAEVRSIARLHQLGAVTDRMMDDTRERARAKLERIAEERQQRGAPP